MKRCAIVGATGYTGQELRRLLSNHRGLEATVLMTARPGVVPDEADIGPLDVARLGDVDGIFLCTPHGAAADIARAALDAGRPVVDLSNSTAGRPAVCLKAAIDQRVQWGLAS